MADQEFGNPAANEPLKDQEIVYILDDGTVYKPTLSPEEIQEIEELEPSTEAWWEDDPDDEFKDLP